MTTACVRIVTIIFTRNPMPWCKINLQTGFWVTICKMVHPMLSDRCLSCLWRWCIVAKWLDGSRRNLAHR